MNKFGFAKVATGVFDVKIGDVQANKASILSVMNMAETEDVELLVLPELCLTGYSCQDMFLRGGLLRKAENALYEIAYMSPSNLITVVGTPLRNNGQLFNCAVVMQDGEIIAVIPKTYIPSHGEFYEDRWFASALEAVSDTICIAGRDIPFGTDIIIESSNGMRVACEICEDLWVNQPPSGFHTANGANVIANPSASNEIVTKAEYRKNLVKMQSARCNCAYVYASAGSGESTTDVVYSGHQLIYSCGSLLNEDKYMFSASDTPLLTTAIIDIEKIDNDQVKMNSFARKNCGYRRIYVEQESQSHMPEYVEPYPFIPKGDVQKAKRCREILSLQATGLATRIKKSGLLKCIIGVSGGLDSTLALLVIKEAFDMLGLPYSNIIGVTMPGFGTTDRTKSSADALMEFLGITSMTVDITKCCKQHLEDIGHEEGNYDVTYENAQARERTQILMDLANKEGGLVVGTGDLSELTLGWCTYGGDHLSNYGVNGSVPKTLVKFIIETYAMESVAGLKKVLLAICDTTISPELLPPDANGEIAQSTEGTLGKYDLHDFFLYHYIRNGFEPEKIFALAKVAFPSVDAKEIEKTLNTFMGRFAGNQFKRNCLPDGPKVGSVSLSPRGDWRMPSDMC